MDSHRQACQRQHRVLGHFLAIQAWLRGLECFAIERSQLEVFLGLERFKSQRIRWLKQDLAPWFPHQVAFFRSNAESSLSTLYIARVPIESWFSEESLTTEERIAELDDNAPKTEVFSAPPKGRRYLKKADIAQYLALLDSGLEPPIELRDVADDTP